VDLTVTEDGVWNFQEIRPDGTLRTFLRVTMTEIVTQHNLETPSVEVAVECFNSAPDETNEHGTFRVYFKD